MKTFEIQLESQTNPQKRTVTTQAKTIEEARAFVEQQEANLASFSLLPPAQEVWEQPPGSVENDSDGIVDLSRWDARSGDWGRWAAKLEYRDAVKAANRRLEELRASLEIDNNGLVKASKVNALAKARVLAHLQEEPYQIVHVAEIEPAYELDTKLITTLVQMHADPKQWERMLDRLRDEGVPMNIVTAVLYGLPWQKQIDGSSVTVWSSATIQTSLHNAYTANQDTEDFQNDVSATEVTGTGYTANGVTLASKTSTYDTATDQIRLDAADASWATSTISATDAVVWVNTAGAATTDPLLGTVDFGATVSTTAGTFLITWDVTGILNFDIT